MTRRIKGLGRYTYRDQNQGNSGARTRGIQEISPGKPRNFDQGNIWIRTKII